MAKKKRSPVDKHSQPLGDQLEDPSGVGSRSAQRQKRQRHSEQEDQDDEELDQLIPASVSARILEAAREQREEVDREAVAQQQQAAAQAGGRVVLGGVSSVAPLSGSDSDDDDDDGVGYDGDKCDDEGWEDEEHTVTAEDEAAIAAFMPPSSSGLRSLADIIVDKIKEQQVAQGMQPSTSGALADAVPNGIDDRVACVYSGVGNILSRYTTGPLPKAFKIIPSLTNWEDVLFLTDPAGWSPHATLQATRIFVSNFNPKLAQRFLTLVLLPAVREDIKQNKRLHFALFQALKKATYKPGAFFKGILLPLVGSGSCSVREAVIVSGVVRRVSLPVQHAAAALCRLAEMEYSGVNSFFIQVLLNKKYALPYRVVDSLVDHFCSFTQEERTLLVVWQQALLTFVQRYKNEIRRDDKECIRRLVSVQYHYQISPEIHRELDAASSREGKGTAAAMEVQARVATHAKEDIWSLPSVDVMEEY